MTEPTVPDRADDDTDVGWGDPSAYDDADDRLRDERPPHHEDRD